MDLNPLTWYTTATGGTPIATGPSYTTPILNNTTSYFVQDSTCLASLTRTVVIVHVNPSPDTSIVKTSETLTSNQVNATYQWLDCNANMNQIPNQTNQFFVATVNGSYAVKITTTAQCVDTSNCITINSVGLNEIIQIIKTCR